MIVSVFIVLIVSVAPVFVVNRMVMKYFPDRNKTLLGLVYTADREKVERFSFVINNVLLPFTAFMIIIVCTTTLVVHLRKKTQWAQKSTSQADSVSNRNRRVAKMVVMISSLFIACFVPISFTFVGMCLEPEFSLSGKYRELLFIIGGVGLILETINSSVNIFIYYHLSSRYRFMFQQIFGTTNITVTSCCQES